MHGWNQVKPCKQHPLITLKNWNKHCPYKVCDWEPNIIVIVVEILVIAALFPKCLLIGAKLIGAFGLN